MVIEYFGGAQCGLWEYSYSPLKYVIWLTAIIREIVIFVVFLKTRTLGLFIWFILFEAPWLISLFIICVSFISIFIKIRFGPHPNPLRDSVNNRERRLTCILFVVLSVSLLTTLPWVIFECFGAFHPELLYSLSSSSLLYMGATMYLLVLANSLVNPITYAMRMPEFRAGLATIFHRTPNHVNAAVLPLHRL